MRHELKIWSQYYARVADGSKTFEVRDNDRGFQNGDTVTLLEYDPNYESFAHPLMNPTKGMFTGKPVLEFKIGYVLPIDDKRVVFSLLPIGANHDQP